MSSLGFFFLGIFKLIKKICHLVFNFFSNKVDLRFLFCWVACALYFGVGLNGLNKLYPFFIMLNCTNHLHCGFLG